MVPAKRARTAETPKQPSLDLTLHAPHFYPDRGLVNLPLPVTKHLQTSRVDDQMKRATMVPGQVRDLNTAMTP